MLHSVNSLRPRVQQSMQSRKRSDMSTTPKEPIEYYAKIVADKIRHSDTKRILFVTGAGMSADSGLPTYRGVSGLYNQGVTEDGCSIEEAISGGMLHNRPEVCWKYIAQIEESCRNAEPNKGHHAIRALESAFEVWVLTQNVDGLHHRAKSKNVIDIHGDVHGIACTCCSWEDTVPDYSGLPYNKKGETGRVWPKCPVCSGLLRPKVVLFGESLDMKQLRTLSKQCELGFGAVLSVGTTSVFDYISWPVHLAAQADNITVEVNPGPETPISDVVDVRVPHGAADFLDHLAQQLLARKAAL